MGCGNVHGTIYRDDLTIQPSYDMDPNTFRAEVYRCGACEGWFCTDAGTCKIAMHVASRAVHGDRGDQNATLDATTRRQAV